jgi:hypothetical protein
MQNQMTGTSKSYFWARAICTNTPLIRPCAPCQSLSCGCLHRV